jgi:hypothetical protein
MNTQAFSDDPHRYDDILNLPHHVSTSRPRMDRAKRAAQFMPFKAMSGYDREISESDRETQAFLELNDDARDELDQTLLRIRGLLTRGLYPKVSISYFLPDSKKEGGSYRTETGQVEKIRDFERQILLSCQSIPLDQVVKISFQVQV